MVICSTWLLGSGTLPTRISRAVSMRRLVSVSSMVRAVLRLRECVERDVILHVIRDQRAVARRHSLVITGGEERVGGKISEPAPVDAVAQLVADNVGLEEISDGRHGGGFIRLAVGHEFGELLFQQLILRLEAWDQAEDLFQYLAQADATIHCRCPAQFFERVVLLRFVENFAVDIVNDAIPLPGFHRFGDGSVSAHGVFETIEEHAINLHAVFGDRLLTHRGDDVRAEMRILTARWWWRVATVATLVFWPRKLQHLVVIELLLEVFAIGEEVEQLERGFVGMRDCHLYGVVEQLVQKAVLARASAFDLDEIG